MSDIKGTITYWAQGTGSNTIYSCRISIPGQANGGMDVPIEHGGLEIIAELTKPLAEHPFIFENKPPQEGNGYRRLTSTEESKLGIYRT